MEDEVGCMVDEYSPANKLSSLVFITQRVSQSTKGGRYVLVTEDTVTRLEVTSSEEAFPEGSIWMIWIKRGDSFLFSTLACFTFWRFAAGRVTVNWDNN